jgi:hypothetical protein
MFMDCLDERDDSGKVGFVETGDSRAPIRFNCSAAFDAGFKEIQEASATHRRRPRRQPSACHPY